MTKHRDEPMLVPVVLLFDCLLQIIPGGRSGGGEAGFHGVKVDGIDRFAAVRAEYPVLEAAKFHQLIQPGICIVIGAFQIEILPVMDGEGRAVEGIGHHGIGMMEQIQPPPGVRSGAYFTFRSLLRSILR